MRDISTKCLICDDTKDNLSKEPQGFSFHTQYVHNIWTYFYFLINIKKKDPNELKGIEIFISQAIAKGGEANHLWIPITTDNIEENVDILLETVTAQWDQLKETNKKLDTIIEKLQRLEDAQASAK